MTALDLARRVAARLGEIEGVVAVALGGSVARGEAQPDSDLDLGLYYEPARPPSLEELRALARKFASGPDDRHVPDLLTDFGGWGPWINGGGWLRIERHPVDWLYRDLERVRRVVDEGLAGRFETHFQPGHPHGFHTTIYMGELHHALVLHDPLGVLAGLKARVAQFPPRLRRALVATWLWRADFALYDKVAARGDHLHASGDLFACAAALVQVLFALNGRYCLNEKGALGATEGFPVRPEHFAERVAGVLAHPGSSPAELLQSMAVLRGLVAEVEALARPVLEAQPSPEPAVLGLHHAQVTIPPGAETEARAFYCGLLALRETPKPESLIGRGGFWLEMGGQQVHVGAETPVGRATTKAHLAYEVTRLEEWRWRLAAAGFEILPGVPIPGYERFELRDPFGNRLELIERRQG